MWDFARGLHAHLPDPRATRPRGSTTTRRSRRRCASAQADRLAEPTPPDGGLDAIAAAREPFDDDALAAQGYGHERLDQLVTELLLGVRCSAAGRRASTRRRRRARSRCATPTPASSSRRAARRTRRRRRPAASRTRERGGRRFEAACAEAGVPTATGPPRSPSPASSTGWSCSTPTARCSGRPSSGTTPSRRPTPRAGRRSSAAPEPWAEACGSVPVAASRSPSCAWLHRCEPECSAASPRVLLPHDWLTCRLTGRASRPTGVTRRGPATGRRPRSATGTDLLALVDDARSTGTRCAARGARPDRARPASGPRRGAVVGPGTGDNMAAALGLGLRAGRRRAVSLGTSAPCSRSATSRPPTRRAPSPASPTPPAGSCPSSARSTPPRSPTRSPACSGSTPTSSTQLALAAPPGAGGLVLVPYLDGERTPNRPDATGTLTGLRTDADPASNWPGPRSRAWSPTSSPEPAAAARRRRPGARVPRRRGRPQRGLPPGRRRPDRSHRSSCPARTSWWPAVPPSRPRLCCTASASTSWPTAWGLGAGEVIEPDPAVDGAAIRAAYATAADREGRPVTDVDELLSAMTIEEKVAQLARVWFAELATDDRSIAAEAGATPRPRHRPDHPHLGPDRARPGGHRGHDNQIQRLLVERTRLGIPAIVHEESTRRLLRPRRDTVPAGTGLAADLGPGARRGGGRRSSAARWGRRRPPSRWRPCVDVARDPRWGRVEETYGEDPELAGRIGIAYVRGIQSQGVACTAASTSSATAPPRAA